MPTFIFVKNKVKVDELRGEDGAALEAKIKKYIGYSSPDIAALLFLLVLYVCIILMFQFTFL